MAKARSPAYPSISLREAVEKVASVYQRDYQNQIPKAVVAQHMGYASLNGKSLGVLSSLSKFGLLEGRGDESRVSDLAVVILAHPTGSSERAQAVRQAASIPALFSELDGRFQSGRASDQAMRSFLLTQKFIPPAADAAIRAYRETKQFVEAEGGDEVVRMIGRDEGEVVSAPISPASGARISGPREGNVAPSQSREGRGNMLSQAYVPENDRLFALGEGEPYRIQLRANGIDVVASFRDVESVDRLVEALNAVKILIGVKRHTQ